MQKNGQQMICDKCQFKFKSFYRQWKLNNNNNKLFIFRVEKKYQALSKNIDLSELIPDYAFVCNSTWFAIYSIKKIQRMRINTIKNLNFKQGTLLIGFIDIGFLLTELCKLVDIIFHEYNNVF